MKGKSVKIICLIFLLWAILLPVRSLWAIPISDIKNPRLSNGTWVSDVANILSDDTESLLNRRISQLAANNSSEIAVVTVPDTAPLSTVKAYATELFNTWGIGKRGLDNGVLFLIAVKERRIEIETGRGVSPYISNSQVAQIIENQIKPELQRQKFDQAVINGVEEIAGRLEKINFYPFPFAPIYSSIGLVGIAIAISGIALIVLKIKSWCQQLPTTDMLFQNPVVFKVIIPDLERVTAGATWMTAIGIALIAVSFNAWILSQEILISLFINPFNQFLVTLLINLITGLTSILIWLRIEKFWLAKLTQTFQTSIKRHEWNHLRSALTTKAGLAFVLHLPAFAVGWLLITTSIILTIPSYVLFALTSLWLAMGYQLILMYVVSDMRLDYKSVKEQYFCRSCRNIVQPLSGKSVSQYLIKPELKAVELGNATYEIYACDRCYPQTNRDRQQVYCQPKILKEDSICPKCSYPTVIDAELKQSQRTKKFPKKASKNAIGIRQCLNCFHEQPVYPFIPAPVSTSSSDFSDNNTDYTSNNSSSSHDSYDYGSSSSSDFGGGSSDGGGAGSDW